MEDQQNTKGDDNNDAAKCGILQVHFHCIF